MKTSVTLTINGKTYQDDVEPRTLLSDYIRHHAGLKGTHVGCEHGVCGACTVMIDGKTARSCLAFAVQCQDHDIQTVESLGTQEELSPLQQGFWEKHGLQCGYCTSGMLMLGTELLAHNPNPTRDEIREAISGNLCRCTGYQTIIDSIARAVEIKAGKAMEAAE